MPPKLKRLSGKDLLGIFKRFSFEVHAQKGSHVKLRRFSVAKEKQTLTIPMHQELDVGTLRSIFRQASRYIDESQLFPHFYSG